MSCRLNPNGFTLIEMLIAMFLLVIGFLSVFLVLWASTTSGRFSRDMTTAANLGQDMLERVGTMKYNDLPETNGFESYPEPFGDRSLAAAAFEARQWRVSSAGSKKIITARITWMKDGSRKTRDFTMIRRSEY